MIIVYDYRMFFFSSKNLKLCVTEMSFHEQEYAICMKKQQYIEAINLFGIGFSLNDISH